ncbi:MBL fold metallo-hydrolase [Pantoea sp. LMR881]|uniref:MBL fold metallo-hydrolase n=1 Tax=Pantoea sp. LMR881 TaxID=3014336 RepID=UPI0022B0247C|nr:MBL fold metallo-hydrolase [Pantoea sp. LMR881]MCZ4058372.1 MBL fold metallo-hydrolase [Pantoea sp. LMR881]
MRIHHLNCGCMCPLGGALYDGFSASPFAHLVCHCLLLETDAQGLILVDTGMGLQDIQRPADRLSGFFRVMNNIRYDKRLSAWQQVVDLGFRPDDVRHIILTHLDFDHAGGITDFPQARIHLLQRELQSATNAQSWLRRQRYRPQQWGSRDGWRGYADGGERWFGFDAVRAIDDLSDDILLVPLPGHTPGHAGVAIRHGQGWMLHGGDAWFYRGEMHHETRHCTPGLRFYQWMMRSDTQAWRTNQQRLRELSLQHSHDVTMFCSHDARELQAFAPRS